MDGFIWYVGAFTCGIGGVLIVILLAWQLFEGLIAYTGVSKQLMQAYGRLLKEKRDDDFNGA